jgi:hypothetical protein
MNRRDRAAYARALSTLKRWDLEGRPGSWTTGEWDDLIARAAAQKGESRESVRFPLLRPLFSAAAALAVLVWAALFFLKTRPADLSARNSARTAEITESMAEEMRPPFVNASPESTRPALSAARRPSIPPDARPLLASAARTERPAGDKPAFTWISPDTGLQIVWFTNNNLNLEVHQ